MKKRILAVFGGLAVAAALAVSLAWVLAGQSFGGAETQTALAIASPGGSSEGIQIHGHWVIEVREPDGSLASRREFDNDLTTGGSLLLGQLLGRTKTIGVWRVQLQGPTGFTGPCQPNPSIFFACIITETNSTATAGSHVSNDLLVTPPVAIGDPLVLQGGVTALVDADISLVSTLVEVCDGTVTATTCNSTGSIDVAFFTTTLPNPVIPVLNGQGINVTVEISAFGPATGCAVTENQPLTAGTVRITVEVQDAGGYLVGNDNTTVFFLEPASTSTITAMVTGTALSPLGLSGASVSATPIGGVISFILEGTSGGVYEVFLDCSIISGPAPTVFGNFP